MQLHYTCDRGRRAATTQTGDLTHINATKFGKGGLPFWSRQSIGNPRPMSHTDPKSSPILIRLNLDMDQACWHPKTDDLIWEYTARSHPMWIMFSSTPAIVGFNLLTSNLDENLLISHRIMKSSQMQLSQTPCEVVSSNSPRETKLGLTLEITGSNRRI